MFSVATADAVSCCGETFNSSGKSRPRNIRLGLRQPRPSVHLVSSLSPKSVCSSRFRHLTCVAAVRLVSAAVWARHSPPPPRRHAAPPRCPPPPPSCPWPDGPAIAEAGARPNRSVPGACCGGAMAWSTTRWFCNARKYSIRKRSCRMIQIYAARRDGGSDRLSTRSCSCRDPLSVLPSVSRRPAIPPCG